MSNPKSPAVIDEGQECIVPLVSHVMPPMYDKTIYKLSDLKGARLAKTKVVTTFFGTVSTPKILLSVD